MPAFLVPRPNLERPFELEEATIPGIHAAITSGQVTCQAVVEAYIDRAKAYNGVCTALLTSDGADIAPSTGYVRAGAPLAFPTGTVKASRSLPTWISTVGCRSISGAWSGSCPIHA